MIDDLISRQAAIDALKAMAVPRYKDPACEDMWERDRTLDNAIVVMRGLPSARRTGRWIVVDEQEPRRYGCSECKRLVWHIENYCPNCGAKMQEEEDG